ncbi:MAG: Lrp/AsnC family transcriptional regulator [Thermoplasmata archaeon]|nr:Lrp/AsnC family transcriptional regulator [Thermoplasmata archaeon]MBE3141890.1 Lrp/AsnC family transcriptional regulator [Thermoplasmata archaeon]
MDVDKIDIAIIEALKKDARTSFREIARLLKISPDTISNRFERLKKEGVIINSTVVIDPSRIGYSFIARFGINVKPAYSPQVLEKIIQLPSVIVASKLVGSHDVIAISVVKDFPHLCRLRDTILEMPYVEKVEVGMWIETMELCPHYFLI